MSSCSTPNSQNLPPELMKRGVENDRIVDLIFKDKSTGEVVLLMIETRPWKTNPSQILQIEDKFNAYLSYYLDGFLVKDYPEYAGLPVRFQLDCPSTPGPEEQEFFNAVIEFSASKGIFFKINVTTTPTTLSF